MFRPLKRLRFIVIGTLFITGSIWGSDSQLVSGVNPKVIEYCNQAFYNYSLGKYRNAIQYYTMALNIDKKTIDAYVGRGKSLYKIRQFDMAILDLTEALALDSNNFDAWLYRGLSYYENRMYTQALADFNKSLELYPSHIKTLYYRGMTYTKLTNYTAAKEDFLNVLKKEPDSQWGQQAQKQLRWLETRK